MAQQLTLTEFITVFRNLKPKEVSGKFTRAKQKDALKKTLIPYAEHAKVLKQLADSKARCATLQDKLSKVSRSDKSTNKTRPTKRKRDETQRENNKNPTKEVPVTIGQYGKARSGCCQKCRNAGLGNRPHPSDKCNDKLREESVARMEARKAKRLRKNAPSNKTERSFPLDKYAEGLCEHCKKQDVDPKYATHGGETCFRRPGGELDELGITDKRERTKKVIELIRQKRQDNKGGKPKETNKTVKIKDSKKSVKITKRSVKVKGTKQNPIRLEPAATVNPAVEDPRLSLPSKHITKRYLRNATAIREPLTEQEITALIHNPDLVYDPKHRAYTKYRHEKLDAE